MLIVHDPRCADYGSYLRPEQPARILKTGPHLRAVCSDWAWTLPTREATDEVLLRGHSPALLRRLTQKGDFDDDTPNLPDIPTHARRSVAAALTAADHARLTGAPTFSLMRPPGHHATPGQAMGFCYLNQIALAALDAQIQGARRVAVWDFDAHHGNGTEDILRGRPDILFVSVHQFPGYPETGSRSIDNCRNFPVAPHCPRIDHLSTLSTSWAEVLAFQPDLILISAGFDAYAHDPITTLSLEIEDFAQIGRWVGDTPIPTAAMLEGGYSVDLPHLVAAFLNAWAAAHAHRIGHGGP